MQEKCPHCGGTGLRAAPHPLPDLTQREMEIAYGIAAGKLNKQIAADLRLSESTIKTHVHTIMKKLGAINRTQVAIRMGASV